MGLISDYLERNRENSNFDLLQGQFLQWPPLASVSEQVSYLT